MLYPEDFLRALSPKAGSPWPVSPSRASETASASLVAAAGRRVAGSPGEEVSGTEGEVDGDMGGAMLTSMAETKTF